MSNSKIRIHFVLEGNEENTLFEIIEELASMENIKMTFNNSAGVVITMLLDWVITIIFAAILIGFSMINIYLGGLLAVVALVIASVIFYFVLFNGVEKKIERIQEF